MTNTFAGWLSLSSRQKPAHVGAGLVVVGFCHCLVLAILWKHCIATEPCLRQLGWVPTPGCSYHSLESLPRRKYSDRHPKTSAFLLVLLHSFPLLIHLLSLPSALYLPLSLLQTDGCIIPTLNFPGPFPLLHSPVQVPGD